MNKSIRQRQTMMVNWLKKTIDYQNVSKASSGSIYFKSTIGTEIRLSDHISTKNKHINVIFNPLNTNVIIIYKLFSWSGSFKDAKNILYTLAWSSIKNNPTMQEVDVNNNSDNEPESVEENPQPVSESQPISEPKPEPTPEAKMVSEILSNSEQIKNVAGSCIKKKLLQEIIKYSEDHKNLLPKILEWIVLYKSCDSAIKVGMWKNFKLQNKK
jgi:hypothetical protein